MKKKKKNSYRCPITKEKGYTLDYCTSTCFGSGCKFLGMCNIYNLNKDEPKDNIVEDPERFIEEDILSC